MKIFRMILLLVPVYLLLGTNVFGVPGTPGPGCYIGLYTDAGYGKRIDNIYYTDCFPRDTTETEDQPRLQRAVTKVNSKLIFNEEIYYISKAIDLHSYLTLEGMSSAQSYSVFPRIQLYVDGTDPVTGLPLSCFRIGSGVTRLAIRDLGFTYKLLAGGSATATNSTGILAAESVGSPFNMTSSQGFQFNNLTFTNFAKGIYVFSQDSSHNWQFDDAQIEDTTFANNKNAIYTDCNNTGLKIDNVVISSAAGQNGIWVKRGAYMSMNMIVGNGAVSGGADVAGEFIHLDMYHGPTSIQNSNGEGYQAQLWIKGRNGSKVYPVELINNVLPACPQSTLVETVSPFTGPSENEVVNFSNAVGFNSSQVFSHGNYYTCARPTNPVTYQIARPEIKGYSDVYSTADKFCASSSDKCYDPGALFASEKRSEFALLSNIGTLRSEHLPTSASLGAVDWTMPISEITSSYSYGEGPVFRPLLKLSTSHYNPSPGATPIPDPDPDYNEHAVVEDYYTFSQNTITGRLEMDGYQNSQKVAGRRPGYNFNDGPLKLQSSTQANLFLYTATGEDGSLLYCSNCVAGSTPCAAVTPPATGGALALQVGAAWHCK